MAAYPENTGGIISAIQACIVAAGGTLTTAYNNNTGGIIQALMALQTAIAGMDLTELIKQIKKSETKTLTYTVTAGDGCVISLRKMQFLE